MYPESLKSLIENFKSFPGIGEKTAERMAFNLLDFDNDRIESLEECIKNVRQNIHKCPICQTLTDKEICTICSDKTRDDESLCVVEDSKIVFLFERIGIYKGKYHVLNGLISPLDEINPEDIGIEKILDRLKTQKYKEIILALKPSIEGEITSLYIKKILESPEIKITRLASGVPMGADMEYIDSLTLSKALEDRKEIS
ncbi:MAG: recombination mediator RecR [bacterium]|jgi:recombination protein recR|nr:recombination mediator RecR [bacterium]